MGSADQFRMTVTRTDRTLATLVHAQRAPWVGKPVRLLLKLLGTDIPVRALAPGRGLVLQHGGHVVVHHSTRLGNDVILMHNVTIGRADLWRPTSADFGGVVVEDDVILGVGAVVLVSKGTVTLGRGSIVGANAVLTRSTEPGEIWAGNPARRIGHRDDDGRRTAEVSLTESPLPSLV
jgi:serine O-acetyltransferase